MVNELVLDLKAVCLHVLSYSGLTFGLEMVKIVLTKGSIAQIKTAQMY